MDNPKLSMNLVLVIYILTPETIRAPAERYWTN